VPVGAVIVKNNKIISKAYNKKEKTKNVTKHAEIIAISKACKKIKNWRLDECEIYVTMEPCMMCCGAIEQSRIKKIIYGVKNEKYSEYTFLY
jgi:tRNA(adenine34) deaminase